MLRDFVLDAIVEFPRQISVVCVLPVNSCELGADGVAVKAKVKDFYPQAVCLQVQLRTY